MTITFTKEGYADGSETRTAQQLAAEDTLIVDKTITATSQVVNVTLSGKVIGVEGTGLKGAVITAGDLTATTGEDGTFTIENFPVVRHRDHRHAQRVSLGGSFLHRLRLYEG